MPVGVRLRGYILPYLSPNPLSSPAPPTVGGLPDEADGPPRPPFRYCRRRFSAVRVRKREIFLGMRGFLGFLEGGLEKVRGVFFEEIFEMMVCDALFLI